MGYDYKHLEPFKTAQDVVNIKKKGGYMGKNLARVSF